MRVGALQGTYYVVTAAAPLVWMNGFEAVTGDKTDEWLVVMVALLTVAIGASLLAGARHAATPAMRILGIGAAAAFASLDLWLAVTGTGSLAYLADLLAELTFVALWVAPRGRRG